MQGEVCVLCCPLVSLCGATIFHSCSIDSSTPLRTGLGLLTHPAPNITCQSGLHQSVYFAIPINRDPSGRCQRMSRKQLIVVRPAHCLCLLAAATQPAETQTRNKATVLLQRLPIVIDVLVLKMARPFCVHQRPDFCQTHDQPTAKPVVHVLQFRVQLLL